jgi:ubiquinone/menaquinone biosynthesis C-methylase UbiE
MDTQQEALAWQTGVWDRISAIYDREIDARFAPIVEGCIARARLRLGESVLDLGTGTGAVAARAATDVGPSGSVTAVDLSTEMLELARRRTEEAQLANVDLREGRAEEIPVPDGAFDVIIASLSLMYAVDRQRAAQECARVLRGGGRFVAAVWAGPEEADIVRFQQTAGMFAPPPPVAEVGPGALADVRPFLGQLREAGIFGNLESEVLEFHFDDFEQAWEVLAGVTTAHLDAERRAEAKLAVQQAMWPDPSLGRRFANRTQYLVGIKQ